MTSKKPNIIVFGSPSGCGYWRLHKPVEALRKLGLVNITWIDNRDVPRNLGEILSKADIVFSSGWCTTDLLITLRQYQSMGLKVVIDYDDLYFNVSPFNPAYKVLGTEEVEVKNPSTGDIQYLWKDGRDGFSLKENQRKFHAWKDTILEADLITTTTLYIKTAMQEISGREGPIKVLPNAIDRSLWKPLDIRDKFEDKFRFGWAVSSSHGEDWLYIRDVIKTFLERHKDAKFVCIGDTHLQLHKVLPKEQTEEIPFSGLWEGHYHLRMAMLGLDCAIAPLADNEFNRCKSPLKYAEYTAFGWPVIAQNMTPYKEHIISGETGILAGTKEEWLNALEVMYKDPSYRSKLRFNAMFTLKELFDLDKVALEWYKVFNELVQGTVLK